MLHPPCITACPRRLLLAAIVLAGVVASPGRGAAAQEPVPPPPPPAAGGAPRVTWGEVTGDASRGLITLRWGGPDVADRLVYQLESARDSGFTRTEARYEGAGTVSFISGLEDGAHLFRIRARRDAGDSADAADVGKAPWGPWSEPHEFVVEHQSMRLAWSLFGTGAVLFVLIALFVITQTGRPVDSDREAEAGHG